MKEGKHLISVKSVKVGLCQGVDGIEDVLLNLSVMKVGKFY